MRNLPMAVVLVLSLTASAALAQEAAVEAAPIAEAQPEPAPPPPQAPVVTVGPDHPERKPILDALRPVVAADLAGQPIVFLVLDIRIQGDWAFFSGEAQRPDRRAVDFSQTRYAQAQAEGAFDGPATRALLERVDGVWTVRTFVIGPTDVAWAAWPADHGVSWALVGLRPPG